MEQKNTNVFEVFDLLDYICDLFCIFKYELLSQNPVIKNNWISVIVL